MRIRAFHIDAFGLFKDTTVDDLPQGLAVFLGRNEAGKSTLLDFFRSTLAGYPLKTRNPRERGYVAGNGSGGSLDLETPEGLVRLTRRPGVLGGEPSLTDSAGQPLDAQVYERLMGGVGRDVYNAVYGFSLRELQEFATLSAEGVRNALYGASFGMGLRSPGKVLRQLETDMEKLFKPAGSRQPVSALLREWEDTRRNLREAEEEASRYDALAAEHDRLGELVGHERRESAACDVERRALERRLAVWRQWEEWRLAGVRLDRLEPVPASFPQDGPGRLERGLTHVEGAERALNAVAERLERTRASRERCHVDAALLGVARALRGLGEHKGACRNALAELPELCSTLERLDDDVERHVRVLGPDWNVERVRAVNSPLASREQLGAVADTLQRAGTESSLAVQTRDRAEADLTRALDHLRVAQGAFDALPVPVADLDEDGRAKLRDAVERVRDGEQRLPERERVLTQVRAEFARAVGHLHLQPRYHSAEGLTALSDAQEPLLAQAREAVELEAAAVEAKRQAERAKDVDEQARERMARTRDQKDDLGDADRESLNGRRAALRNLRHVLALLPVEESRLQEAEEQLTVHLAAAPETGSHPLLVAFGGVLAVAGAGAIAALKLWGLTAVTLTPELTLPLVLWHGYLVLLAGLAFVAAGLPRKRPEAERHAAQAEQLRQRIRATDAKVRDLLAERERLRDAAGLADLFPDALDALETTLERERDQCAAGERLDRELAVQADEAAELRQRVLLLETEFARRNTEALNVRRRLHERLMELGVQAVPAPDGVAAFFARVDSARAVWSQVETLEQELADMRGRAGQLATLARACLPEAAWPAAWDNAGQVLEAVQVVLESCRRAELAAEERRRAMEAVRAAEARYEHQEGVLATAVADVAAVTLRLGEAEEAWAAALAAMGLPERLSPSTAQEALRCVDRVLALEAERARLRDTQSQRERERDAFLTSCTDILKRLGRLPENLQAADLGTEALALYDTVLDEAEAACRADAERQRLEKVLDEEESEWRAASAVRTDAQQGVSRLLRQAEAVDPEDFLRRHALKIEREALVRRREDLEDALRLAAGDAPFTEFVEAFAHLEKDELESRVEQLTGRLALLAENDRVNSDALRTLALRLEHLAASASPAALRRKEAALAESLQQLGQEWGRLALAHTLVNKAKRRFEEERQPDVVRIASALFATITAGRWQSITASLEDSSLNVLPPYGEPVAPELLSRGTQEQLYLALRLAHIRNHAAHSAPLPVILDDILVNFDPERAERTIQALAELTRPEGLSTLSAPSGRTMPGRATPGHQVMFFTCHPQTAELLAATPGSGLFTVEHGKVIAIS